MKASTLGTTNSVADVLQSAVVAIIDNHDVKVNSGQNGFYQIWMVGGQKGVCFNQDGFSYLREGVLVLLQDERIIVRQLVDNAMIAGEITLTGSMTRNFELIVGSIESALGMAL